MKRIESFTVNHLVLDPGLYISRKDSKSGVTVTTYDLRYTKPNVDEPMDISAMHTIEHLGATYLRNSEKKDDVVYFGPMGCRTGFYLLMFGEPDVPAVHSLLCGMCGFIMSFEGDIPGASAVECGNYTQHDLEGAKKYTGRYITALKKSDMTGIYPE